MGQHYIVNDSYANLNLNQENVHAKLIPCPEPLRGYNINKIYVRVREK